MAIIGGRDQAHDKPCANAGAHYFADAVPLSAAGLGTPLRAEAKCGRKFWWEYSPRPRRKLDWVTFAMMIDQAQE